MERSGIPTMTPTETHRQCELKELCPDSPSTELPPVFHIDYFNFLKCLCSYIVLISGRRPSFLLGPSMDNRFNYVVLVLLVTGTGY